MLQTQAEQKADSAESYFAIKKSGLQEADIAKITENIARMHGALEGKEYVSAMKLSSEVMDGANKTSGADGKMLILLTAVTVVVLGSIAMYIMKQQGGGGAGFGFKIPGFEFKSGEKKKFRRLKRIDEDD